MATAYHDDYADWRDPDEDMSGCLGATDADGNFYCIDDDGFMRRFADDEALPRWVAEGRDPPLSPAERRAAADLLDLTPYPCNHEIGDAPAPLAFEDLRAAENVFSRLVVIVALSMLAWMAIGILCAHVAGRL